MRRLGAWEIGAALVAVGGALLAVLIARRPSVRPAPVAPSSQEAPRIAARGERPDDYLDGIMSRNLFDAEAIATWNPAATGDDGVPIAKLDVVLLGTVVTVPDTLSSALIRHPDEDRTRSYSLHEEVLGHEIVRIQPRRVTLRAPDGQTVLLQVDGDAPIAMGAPAPVASPGGIEPLGGSRFGIDGDVVKRFTLDEFAKSAKVLPDLSDEGKVQSFEISALEEGDFAHALGFRDGDVLLAVNGRSFLDHPDVTSAFRDLPADGEFCADIVRRGRNHQLCFEVR